MVDLGGKFSIYPPSGRRITEGIRNRKPIPPEGCPVEPVACFVDHAHIGNHESPADAAWMIPEYVAVGPSVSAGIQKVEFVRGRFIIVAVEFAPAQKENKRPAAFCDQLS